MARNPFANMKMDLGGNIDPFGALRNSLGTRLFNNANIFGDQGMGFLSSQGRFDPNLAEAMKQHQFGIAQSSLSDALANLAGQEGQFREGQRQYNNTFELNRKNSAAEWDAAQPNALDWISGIGSLALGVGTLGMGGAGLGKIGGGLAGLFKKFLASQGADATGIDFTDLGN